MARTRGSSRRRRRRHAQVDHDLLPADADHEFEAQLQVELALRRAERGADTTRKRAQRAARRRFTVAVLVLLAAVGGIGWLIWTSFQQLFGS